MQQVRIALMKQFQQPPTVGQLERISQSFRRWQGRTLSNKSANPPHCSSFFASLNARETREETVNKPQYQSSAGKFANDIASF
jgi:hypothetical protein